MEKAPSPVSDSFQDSSGPNVLMLLLGGAAITFCLFLVIAGLLVYQLRRPTSESVADIASTASSELGTTTMEESVRDLVDETPVDDSPMVDATTQRETSPLYDPPLPPTVFEDVAINAIGDEIESEASMSPVASRPLPLGKPGIPIIRAYTIDQWSLPKDDEIVDAAIYRWIDEKDAFEFRQSLTFDTGALQINAMHGGLGQPIVIFRINTEGTFRNVQSKWKLDHHTDWLWVQTQSETVMLAIGREPSHRPRPTVYCDVFANVEPVGSDDAEISDVQDGSVEIPINTFRASKIVNGVTRWSVVPPFSRSRLLIDGVDVPWQSMDLAPDGLSCRWDLETQGDWMIAVEDHDSSFSSESMSSHNDVHLERTRVEIRTALSIRLTSTLDDRQAGRLSQLYTNELSQREKVTLDRSLRMHQLRGRWRRPTSPMDLQDQDTAYLSLNWNHFRSVPSRLKIPPIDVDVPNMTDVAVDAREHPIPVSVTVPSVQFLHESLVDNAKEGSIADAELTKRLVFAEFEIHCR